MPYASYVVMMTSTDLDAALELSPTEDNFRYVKEMQRKNLIVPLVGDYRRAERYPQHWSLSQGTPGHGDCIYARSGTVSCRTAVAMLAIPIACELALRRRCFQRVPFVRRERMTHTRLPARQTPAEGCPGRGLIPSCSPADQSIRMAARLPSILRKTFLG
jgi:hypothetical protein